MFCSDAIILLKVGEAAALCICTAEVLLGRISLGAAPGSPRNSSYLVWMNFAVMIFGELVVTDGIVEWLARTFRKRYVIAPSLEWSRMKSRAEGFLVVAVFTLSVSSCATMPLYFRNQGCITAFMGEEEEWSVTSCPAVPTKITQMLKVGESWQDEWLAANAN